MIVKNHILLTNGHIIDVEYGMVKQGTIEIRDGIIYKIHEMYTELPQDVTQIDLNEKYVIPGLIDMHCHIREHFAPHFVAAGVTTVRNTAGDTFMLKSLIEARADAPTPTIYASDSLIDGEPGLWGPSGVGNFVTDNPNAARKEVARQAEVGAKFIKVYGLIKEDVMRAVVEEANKYNLEVSCDLHHSKNIDALKAATLGVKWFEHASGFAQGIYPNWHLFADEKNWNHIDWQQPDKEKITAYCEKMLSLNVKLCPTLILYDQAERLPEYWNPSNLVSQSSEQYFDGHWTIQLEQQQEALKNQVGFMNSFTKIVAKTYADLGGTVVAGTDTPAIVGIYPGMALHRELELFVEIGFTQLQALQAATIHAAQAIHIEDIGLIKEGYIANLILLHENPLEKISNTQQIYRVVKGGKLYSQEECLEGLINS